MNRELTLHTAIVITIAAIALYHFARREYLPGFLWIALGLFDMARAWLPPSDGDDE